MSIGDAFAWWAVREPDATAVRCGDDVVSRAELDARADAVARGWVARGLAVDDHVTVALPNGVDLVVACVAAWKAGATPQPLSPELPEAERRAVLALARPRVVVDAALAVPGRDEFPALPAGLAASSWKAPTSSGTTAGPKLVRAAGAATIDPERAVAPFLPVRATQLVAGPLWHAAPFVYALRGLMTGHELVVMPRFDPGDWLALAEAHRVTWGMLVPTMMRRLLREPRWPTADLTALESVLHLGARCAPDVKRAWIERLGPDRVVEVYAGTESQGLTMATGREWLERPGTVGRPVGGSRFRVVRPDGSACAAGELGEVLMRRDPPTPSSVGADDVTRDGWHTLGDAGWLDAEGWLFLADRLDDVITSGGVSIHPADVESVLEQHPAVRSVVVVARPDDDLGERVHAVVDTAGSAVTTATLAAYAAAHLAPERRPRSWQLVDVPLRSDTGKARRRDWR